jgi:eukaryotic-like serine/threonine-protein kinase
MVAAAVPPENPDDFADTLPPGTELGRYRIARLMGRGGMGAVYEGVHRDLKKRVAIKTLHPAVAASAEARARFLREGQAASRIQHPNVVDVTDVGTEGNITYLVMEFLEGEDLAALLERRGALPIAESVDILLQVLGAIAVAHEEGVVHRDLKPGNLFMERTRHGGSKPVVLDFGISKLSARGGGNTLALTGTGAAMGTPYYVAPEQFRSAAGADGRSDQYALGAILYECVAGQRAHQGDSIYEVIRSVAEGSFRRPRDHRPDLPPALEEAILRAMQLDPAARFPSVSAFGQAILPFASMGVREQWQPALAGDARVDAHPPPLAAAPQGVGGPPTASPAPYSAARVPAVRSSVSPNTTFGASAAQMIVPVRRRSGVMVAGVAVLAGGAVAAYLLIAGGPRKPPPRSIAVAARSAESMPPARYRVAVQASPASARFDLDGRSVATGHLVEELAADGTEHTLVVAAPGFAPAKLVFRDRPPPEKVTLEPTAPPPTAAPPAARSRDGVPLADGGHPVIAPARVREPVGGHRRRRPPGASPSTVAPPPSDAVPARSANSAAIIE